MRVRLRVKAYSSTISVALALSCALPAKAQETTPAETNAPEQTPATPAAPSSPATVPAPTPGAEAAADPMMAEFAKFEAIDKLRPQGQTTNFPGAMDSVFHDVGGWRSRLAESNLDLRGSSVTSFSKDVFDNGVPRSPQRFSGQKGTLSNATSVTLSWKFAGEGEDIGQLTAGAQSLLTTWEQVGPTQVQLIQLNYYQSFGNRRVEVTAGFNTNIVNFVGIFAGGNPLLAGGLAATIPAQVGMSVAPAPAPTLNVQVNGNNGFYAKSGIQRSISQQGVLYEARNNGIGLKLTRGRARPLLIQEVGVLRPASPDGRQIWLRAGGMYNLSEYDRFDGAGTEKNWAAYVLADYQVYKPSTTEPYRGVFAGFSALFGSSRVNVYRRTYEARAYAIGMIPGRSTDSITVTLGYNGFSKDAGRALESIGQPTERSQWSVSGLYSFHAGRGIYIAPSITYLENPSFIGNFKPVLNASLGVNVVL